MIDMVSIANFSFAIITFAFLGFVLSLNIGGGMRTFSVALTSLVISLPGTSSFGIGFAISLRALCQFLLVSPIKGALLLVETIPPDGVTGVVIFSHSLFVGFIVCAAALIQSFFIGDIIGVLFFLDAVTISIAAGAVIFGFALLVGSLPRARSFDGANFAMGMKNSTRLTLIIKVFTCSGFGFTTFGTGLLGRVCGIMGHSNSLLTAVAQARDTREVLPGTLYWFTAPSISQVWAVSQ
jgi:hypothetical protein